MIWYNINSMKLFILLAVVLFYCHAQVCSNGNQGTTIDFPGDSKQGDTKMNQLGCNSQTNIDFTFGQGASGSLNLKSRTDDLHYLQFDGSNGDAKLQFLDLNGNNRSYSLDGITLVPIAKNRVNFLNFMGTKRTHCKF